jgi:hypothetical protein
MQQRPSPPASRCIASRRTGRWCRCRACVRAQRVRMAYRAFHLL